MLECHGQAIVLCCWGLLKSMLLLKCWKEKIRGCNEEVNSVRANSSSLSQ